MNEILDVGEILFSLFVFVFIVAVMYIHYLSMQSKTPAHSVETRQANFEPGDDMKWLD